MEVVEIEGFEIEKREVIIYKKAEYLVIASYKGEDAINRITFWDFFFIYKTSCYKVLDKKIRSKEEFKSFIKDTIMMIELADIMANW